MDYDFGTQENLTCLADIALTIESDEALCLAHKTMTFSIGVPAYFEDQGYVLAVKDGMSQYYPLPSESNLQLFQAGGMIPDPLPSYTIPPEDYLMGFLFWIVLVVGSVLWVIHRKIKKRRKASLETKTPPGDSPLKLSTKADRWLADEASGLLDSGETIDQQAYGNDVADPGASGKGLYAVLTNRRLIIIHSRIGAFGPLRENRGVTQFARDDIARVEADERHLRFVLKDGQTFDFFAQWSERHLSNQRRFLSDVPRLFGR